MVRGHKVKTLWPMASPLNLLSATCYGILMRFVQWNSGFFIHGAFFFLFTCTICSTLRQSCGSPHVCSPFVWTVIFSIRIFGVRWTLLFGN